MWCCGHLNTIIQEYKKESRNPKKKSMLTNQIFLHLLIISSSKKSFGAINQIPIYFSSISDTSLIMTEDCQI